MPSNLPSRPDLSQLKRLAKALLADARRNDPQSLERLGACLVGITAQTAKLAQAQTVIAREYGFASWPALVEAVELRVQQLADKAARIAARTTDAPYLAATWYALADARDLDRLWWSMAVGKHKSAAARLIMLKEPERYDRFVDLLVEGLKHPNGRARFEYAHILDSFGDARCIEPLRALMDDEVPRVRWMAMHALTCHDCNAETCPDDPELVARIADHAQHDPSPNVRRHATVALGEVAGPAYLRTMESILANAPDRKMQMAAEYGLKLLRERVG